MHLCKGRLHADIYGCLAAGCTHFNRYTACVCGDTHAWQLTKADCLPATSMLFGLASVPTCVRAINHHALGALMIVLKSTGDDALWPEDAMYVALLHVRLELYLAG